MERVFIGIYPDKKILKEIEKINSISATLFTGAFIGFSNMHITVQFIGYVKKEKIDSIIKNIKQAINNFNKFELEYESLGCFPSVTSPRILWIGLKDKSGVLYNLKQRLDSLNKEFIRTENRPFTPHLTLLKIKKIQDYNAFLSLINHNKNVSFGKETVDSICLIKSVLKKSGAEYSVMEKFSLGIYL